MIHGYPIAHAGAEGSALPPATRWVRASRTLWRNAGTSVVLLPYGDDRRDPLVMSGSAALVWKLLALPATLGQLASELAGICDVDETVIAADLAPMLDHLRAVEAVEQVL